MAATRRIVLLGKTGTGKSSFGNTVFEDGSVFRVVQSPNSQTSECLSVTRTIHGREITIIDTPGLFDTDPNSTNEFSPELMRCLEAAAPGPHAFLLLLKVERYTSQESAVVNLILRYFSEDALRFTTIVFTHGEDLPAGLSIADWARENKALRELLEKCGNRCHVVDNVRWRNNRGPGYRNNRFQVLDLLSTIDRTVEANGGRHFTSEFLQNRSLWGRLADATVGFQVAVFLGVSEVSYFLYNNVPWAEIKRWVCETVKHGVDWIVRHLPSNEQLRRAVEYLASLASLFCTLHDLRTALPLCSVQ